MIFYKSEGVHHSHLKITSHMVIVIYASESQMQIDSIWTNILLILQDFLNGESKEQLNLLVPYFATMKIVVKKLKVF